MPGILQLQKRTEKTDDVLCIGFFVGFTPDRGSFRPGEVLPENLPGAQREEGSPGELLQNDPALYGEGVVLIGAVDETRKQGQIADGVIRFSGSGVRHGVDMLQIPVEPGIAVEFKGKAASRPGSLQHGKIVEQKDLPDAVGILRVLQSRKPFPESGRGRRRRAEELPANEREQIPVKAVFGRCRPGMPIKRRELRRQFRGRMQRGRGQKPDPVISARIFIPGPKQPVKLTDAVPDLRDGAVTAAFCRRPTQKLQPGGEDKKRKPLPVGRFLDRGLLPESAGPRRRERRG